MLRYELKAFLDTHKYVDMHNCCDLLQKCDSDLIFYFSLSCWLSALPPLVFRRVS